MNCTRGKKKERNTRNQSETAKSIKQRRAGITGDLFSRVVRLVNNYVSRLIVRKLLYDK